MRIVFILLCLSISSSHAILGDLNLDGTVGFDDFFIFADNFGKSGSVDTLRVEVFDTTFVEQVVEIFDTTTVEMTVEIFDTTAVTIFDTMEVDIAIEVFDTTLVTILDTLQLETVFDTVTVEFVGPPEDIIITDEPDRLIWDRQRDLPLKQIASQFIGCCLSRFGTVVGTDFLREARDADDDPKLFVSFDDVPIVASHWMRYVPLSATDSLALVASDTIEVFREVRVLSGSDRYFEVAAIADTLRIPSLADTRGDLIVDIVYRTPLQGDFAARVITPVQIGGAGKILL